MASAFFQSIGSAILPSLQQSIGELAQKGIVSIGSFLSDKVQEKTGKSGILGQGQVQLNTRRIDSLYNQLKKIHPGLRMDQ